MPQTAAANNPDLAIVLNHHTTFLGGQTVSGYVSRQSPLVDPNSTVTLNSSEEQRRRSTSAAVRIARLIAAALISGVSPASHGQSFAARYMFLGVDTATSGAHLPSRCPRAPTQMRWHPARTRAIPTYRLVKPHRKRCRRHSSMQDQAQLTA